MIIIVWDLELALQRWSTHMFKCFCFNLETRKFVATLSFIIYLPLTLTTLYMLITTFQQPMEPISSAVCDQRQGWIKISIPIKHSQGRERPANWLTRIPSTTSQTNFIIAILKALPNDQHSSYKCSRLATENGWCRLQELGARRLFSDSESRFSQRFHRAKETFATCFAFKFMTHDS